MSGFSIDELKESLLSSIASLLENRNEYLNNPAADFTRHKLISFEKTILFSLIAEGGTLSTEILNYFPAEKMPTASALIQQKHKIKTKAYEDLFKNFTDKLPVLNTIKGLRAIAVDGSHLNAPYNPRDEFSYTNSIKDRKGHNELVLNAAYDPINNVFLDAVIQGYHSMNEPGAYCTMVDRYACDPYSALFIMDRGYATYNTIAHSIHNKQYFLIRAKQSFVYGLSKDNSVLHGTEEFDERITIHIGRKNTQNCRMYENYHCLRKSTRTYDYLRDDDDIDTLSFRVLRIKINDSLTEYIVTHLPE